MQTRHIRNLVILFATGAAIALATPGGMVSGQTAPPANDVAGQKEPAADLSVVETAKSRLATAERTCKLLHDSETGDPRGHQGVEHTYVWSKRRMEAEIGVERTKPGGGDGGVAAIERHLEWMRAWNERVVKSGAFSIFDGASTEFYIAEAEDLLARAKAK